MIENTTSILHLFRLTDMRLFHKVTGIYGVGLVWFGLVPGKLGARLIMGDFDGKSCRWWLNCSKEKKRGLTQINLYCAEGEVQTYVNKA